MNPKLCTHDAKDKAKAENHHHNINQVLVCYSKGTNIYVTNFQTRIIILTWPGTKGSDFHRSNEKYETTRII